MNNIIDIDKQDNTDSNEQVYCKTDSNNKDNQNSPSELLDRMSRRTVELCKSLSKDSIGFKEEDFIEKVKQYIKEYDRILYSSITNFIYETYDKEHSTFNTNLDKIRDYVYSKEYEELYLNKDEAEIYINIKKIILKIWDHSNLAQRQYISFKSSDDSFSAMIEEKLKTKENIIMQSMNTQVISVVAIFTALAFMVFGGISSLSSILSNLALDMEIEKIIAISCIWGIFLINVIYLFIYLVLKVTKLELNSNKCIIIVINIVLAVIFLISILLYYNPNLHM